MSACLPSPLPTGFTPAGPARAKRGPPRAGGIVTVIDGHPAALGWLGSVRGHKVEALGVEQFGQTGSIGDLYRHHGIDANAIIDAAESLTVGAPGRHRELPGEM